MPLAPAASTARYAPSRRDRVVSFVLAVLAGVLMVYVLIVMSGISGGGSAEGGQLVAISISPPSAEKEKQKAAPKQDVQRERVQVAVTPPPRLPPRVVVPSKNQQVEWPPGFIKLSKADLAKADISQIKPAGSAGSAGAAAGGGGAAEGSGDGPGGARVYNAEWYREPSNAELSPYMRGARGGSTGDWAMIICHTVERYHVEDCREVDESPRGSGLARALRQAAWQFLVRPPRVDGKPQVGAWVRIRFDFRASKRDELPVPE